MNNNQLLTDLLTALKRVLEHHGYTPAGPDFPEAWEAITRAEGRILWDQYQAALKRLDEADNVATICG